MTATWDPLDDFARAPFVHAGREVPVYRRGTAGPAVIVIHEIPGITPEVARFARWVSDAGFRVALPSLFGDPGRPKTPGYLVGQIARACISAEFAVLARHASSPVTDLLRALAREEHTACGGRGVGAIGMCLTGNFALAMAVDPWLQAPVLSQPSLPFAITPCHARALHVSPEALAMVQARVRDDGLKVLGLRFSHDLTSPAARFETLRVALGDGFEGHELDSSLGNPHGHAPWAHSVLTNDLTDDPRGPTRKALARVTEFLAERIR